MGKQDILDKIKIAVIDSGIDKALKSGITEIRNYTGENEFDLNGHGTSVFNYITGYCQNIDVIICKVLNSSGKSESSPLIAALTDLLDTNVNIICMPLSFAGFENEYTINIIHKLLEELNKKGVIIVCSYKNGSKNSFPACDQYVVGVYGGYLDNNSVFWYKNRKMVTNIYPECIRTLNNKRCFFSGNSKACALATVIVIEIAQKINNSSYINIYDKLSSDARQVEWDYNQVDRSLEKIFYYSGINRYKVVYEKSLIIKKIIINILKNYVKDEFLVKTDRTFDDDYYNLVNNMDEFINLISKKLSIKISDKDIFPYDFINLDYLINAVSRWDKNYEET